MSDEEQQEPEEAQAAQGDEGGGDEADDIWAAALAEQKDDVEPHQADELTGDLEGGDLDLSAILDIPVTISMEIGRSRINIRNLLQLSQGSIVELDRLAGEPLDVMVNGTLIAQGEVVVVNEKFGIRLTDVISPAERVKKLK